MSSGDAHLDVLYGDVWVSLPFASMGFEDFKYSMGENNPAKLSWVVNAPEQSLPLSYRSFIRFWFEDMLRPDGSTQDGDHPLFEGFVEMITPGGDSRKVNMTAYAPPYRLTNEFILMSAPYTLDETTGKALEGFAAYPRVVYNNTIDNDDDYAYSIGNEGTISQILAGYFRLMRAALVHCKAGPDDMGEYPFEVDDLFDDGIVSEPSDDFVSLDPGDQTSTTLPSFPTTTALSDSSSLDVVPEEKVVEESNSLTAAIQRLLQQYSPAYRFYWQPGERLWRFYNIEESDTVLITANDTTATNALINMDLARTVEGRYGAVKFYGPERLARREVHWWRPDLLPVGEENGLNDCSTGTILEYIGAAEPVFGKNRWQIADENYRRIGRKLPNAETIPQVYGQWGNSDETEVYELFASYIETWSPNLQCRWIENNSGSDMWRTVTGFRMDARNGIIYFPSTYVYRYNKAPPAIGGIAQPHYEPPVEVKFIYPAFDPPIIVRYPPLGYQGTIYSVAGIENVLRMYDEMLAVGRHYNYPVTTATRLDRFTRLAEHIHQQRKDIAYSGGITVDGIVWDWAWLNRRVNLTAKSASGGTIITGWEAMRAPISDVEYDFNENTTTINFNSDMLEQIGVNIDLLKARLKIRQANVKYWFTWSTAFTTTTKYTQFGTPVVGQDVFISGQAGMDWVDDQGNAQ